MRTALELVLHDLHSWSGNVDRPSHPALSLRSFPQWCLRTLWVLLWMASNGHISPEVTGRQHFQTHRLGKTWSLCSLRANKSPCIWRTVYDYCEDEKWRKENSLSCTVHTWSMVVSDTGFAKWGPPHYVLTLLFSLHWVSMTIIWDFCCRTIFQKSFLVSGSGPCVAIYSWDEL